MPLLFAALLTYPTHTGLAKAADEGHTTHAIIMDFEKAFDKVPHLLLLQKLQGIPGINTHLLNWILDFLSDRQQSVVLRGSKLSRVQSNFRSAAGICARANPFPMLH